jgi:dienelactone hydrolase
MSSIGKLPVLDSCCIMVRLFKAGSLDPVFLLLHDCFGIDEPNKKENAWINRLVKWGYASFLVDSFRPRDISAICNNLNLILGHDRKTCSRRLRSQIISFLNFFCEPEQSCSNKFPLENNKHEAIFKGYPGAYHGFDYEAFDETYEGHRLLYDPIAGANFNCQ